MTQQQTAAHGDNSEMITLGDYEQLNLITWQRESMCKITRKDALSLYERNWRFVDKTAMTVSEKEFLQSLIANEGKGVFLG